MLTPEIAPAIKMANASGATALNVLASPMLYANRQLIIRPVAELRVPAIYQFPEMAEEGGFVAYGPRLGQIFRELVAPIIVKLLRLRGLEVDHQLELSRLLDRHIGWLGAAQKLDHYSGH